jgi:hypothetical protein
VSLAVQWIVAGYLVYLRLLAACEGVVTGVFYPMPYYHLLATMDWTGAVVSAVALPLAIVLPLQPWVPRFAAALERHALSVAVAVTLVLCVLAVTAHQAYPFTSDEYAPTFQSQIFARGRITGQWRPEMVPMLVTQKSFLNASTVTGQCCSDYAPGHALLMTPFTLLGIPWACNPVLAGICTWLLAAVARQAFGRPAAGWAMLLALTSPVFMAYGISFYAMMAHAALNLFFVWLLLEPTLPRVACAGLVGGFALVLHNPFPHAVFALPWIVWLARHPQPFIRLAILGVCYAVVCLPIDGGWDGVEAAIREDRSCGTVSDNVVPADLAAPDRPVAPVPARPSRTIGEHIDRLRGYLTALALPTLDDLWWSRFSAFLRLVAWDAPALVPLACYGAWRNRRNPYALLLAGSLLTTFAAYAFIPMSGGHGWGYRYLFSAWSCLPVLAGSLAMNTSENRDNAADRGITDLLTRVGLATILAAAISLPMRCLEIHNFIKGHRSQLPPIPAVREGTVVVSFIDPRSGYFKTDLVRNDPFMDIGPYVFVSYGRTNDEHNITLLAEKFRFRYQKAYDGPLGTTWLLLPTANHGTRRQGTFE